MVARGGLVRSIQQYVLRESTERTVGGLGALHTELDKVWRELHRVIDTFCPLGFDCPSGDPV